MSGVEDKDESGSNGGVNRDAAGGNEGGNEAQPFPSTPTNPPTTDDTLSSAPASVNPDAGTNSPASGPEAVTMGQGRSKAARARGKARAKSGLPHWRLAQLRAAGRARGKQLKADPAHQSKAGKARASQTDMKALGAEGNARAIELDPQHQSRAGRGGRGKRKSRGSQSHSGQRSNDQ